LLYCSNHHDDGIVVVVGCGSRVVVLPIRPTCTNKPKHFSTQRHYIRYVSSSSSTGGRSGSDDDDDGGDDEYTSMVPSGPPHHHHPHHGHRTPTIITTTTTTTTTHPLFWDQFVEEKVKSLGTAACPPYHLALVVGGLSAELNLKTVKLASIKYLDNLPTRSGSSNGSGGSGW